MAKAQKTLGKESHSDEDGDDYDEEEMSIVGVTFSTEMLNSQEAIAKSISKTREELSIIKEARDELISQYTKYKDATEQLSKLAIEKETLFKENEQLKSENQTINEKLKNYIETENKINTQKRFERLTALSNNFRLLGQEKTVEQLSTKDDETLAEFEKIVFAALEKTGETKAMPSATVPSNSVESLGDEVKEFKSEVVQPKVETSKTVNNEQFFKKICGELTKEQVTSGRKKILAL